MGKYEVKWCRIWDFEEEFEAETEEEVYEKILEERKTAGSSIEIISVMPLNIEEIKQKGKKEKYDIATPALAEGKDAQEVIRETIKKQIVQKKKVKK